MEHAKIDALVNKMNVDTATGPVDCQWSLKSAPLWAPKSAPL